MLNLAELEKLIFTRNLGGFLEIRSSFARWNGIGIGCVRRRFNIIDRFSTLLTLLPKKEVEATCPMVGTRPGLNASCTLKSIDRSGEMVFTVSARLRS